MKEGARCKRPPKQASGLNMSVARAAGRSVATACRDRARSLKGGDNREKIGRCPEGPSCYRRNRYLMTRLAGKRPKIFYSAVEKELWFSSFVE